MRKIIVLLVILLVAGCSGDNFSVRPVVEGQLSPSRGYNFGPDSYVQPGDVIKVSGLVIWIDGLDPNDLQELVNDL